MTPTAVEPMSDATSELFGYVIREAVTNVVRHSEARKCVIAVGPREVSVTDDGTGISGRRSGSGLTGLRERMDAAGGELTVQAGPHGGTRVSAELPTGRPTDGPAPLPHGSVGAVPR